MLIETSLTGSDIVQGTVARRASGCFSVVTAPATGSSARKVPSAYSCNSPLLSNGVPEERSWIDRPDMVLLELLVSVPETVTVPPGVA